jgi:hypothetical protein
MFRVVLKDVAVEAYRSGTITPAGTADAGLHSRWETKAYHDQMIYNFPARIIIVTLI